MQRRTIRILLIALASLCSLALNAEDNPFQLEQGFTAFFNDKDLSGWTVRGGDILDGSCGDC